MTVTGTALLVHLAEFLARLARWYRDDASRAQATRAEARTTPHGRRRSVSRCQRV